MSAASPSLPRNTGIADNNAKNSAAAALLDCLKTNAFLPDDALHALIDAEPTSEEQKRLAVGLYHAGLIDRDRCAALFLWFPMREA